MIKILIIGTNIAIMATIERLINKEGNWKATIALSEEAALTYYSEENFNVVLLCAGLENELELKEKLVQLKPTIPIIKHYGGGSGLLFAEIHEALR